MLGEGRRGVSCGCVGAGSCSTCGCAGDLRSRPLSGGSATESPSAVGLPPAERCTGGGSTAEGVRGGSASPFSWHVPREGRSAAHPTPKGTHDSSFVRSRSNASALVTGSRRKRRSLEHRRTNAESCIHPQHQPAARDPRPARSPAARSRPLRRPHPAKAEAAHQQARTSRGCAPAGGDPLRQRTSKAKAPRKSSPHARNTPTRRSPRRRGPVGASIVCARGERQVTRWGACRGWRPSCDARGACGRSYP